VASSATTNGKPVKKPERLFADSTTASEAAFLILHWELDRFLTLQPQVLAGEDPEAVHQLRVTVRRMREAIDSMASFIPKSLVALEPDLKWLFHLLGDVRDLDVAIETLQSREEPNLAEVILKLQMERSSCKSALVEQMRSERHTEMLSKLQSGVRKGPPTAGLGASALLAVAPDLVVRHGKHVCDLGEKGNPAEYHLLRRRAKKFRYTLDFYSEMYGMEAENLVERLKYLQDLLGERQDAVWLAGKLRGLDCEGLPKEARAAVRKETRSLDKTASIPSGDMKSALSGVFGKPWKCLKQTMAERRRDLWSALKPPIRP
jgi:CHAD domain-containing protein